MTGQQPAVVKVRLRSHVYTSRVMTHAEATVLRDDVRKNIRAAGDGLDFVEFVDRHDREVSLRAREVVIVELGVPERDDEQPRRGRHHANEATNGGARPMPAYVPAGARPLGVVQGGAMAVPVPDGTEFLRQQSIDRHPAGKQR